MMSRETSKTCRTSQPLVFNFAINSFIPKFLHCFLSDVVAWSFSFFVLFFFPQEILTVWPERGPQRNKPFADPRSGLLSPLPGSPLNKRPRVQRAARARPHLSECSLEIQKSVTTFFMVTFRHSCHLRWRCWRYVPTNQPVLSPSLC